MISADVAPHQASRNKPRVATMFAAELTQPGQFSLVEAAQPIPAPGQVRVRLTGCGVCASSLPVFQGRDWFNYPQAPGAPGHEGWGVIDALGEGVATSHPHLKPGVPVAMLSYAAFAAYDLADAAHVVPLPAELANRPFPAEALGCAMNIFARAEILPGQIVAIVGMGFLGGLLTQLCRAAGATVIAVSHRPYSLHVAEDCGAHHLVPMQDHWQVISDVRSLTGGHFCPVVIECTGLEWPLNLSAELTAERGRLVVAGYHQDGMRSVNMQLWNWRGLDVVSAHERDPQQYIAGMREAIAASRSGRWNPDGLITHQLPLARTQEAFQLLQARPDGFVKAVINLEDLV